VTGCEMTETVTGGP